MQFGRSCNPREAGIGMSLKFGIYLVEQRIVSPEQFCGLVKIQQEATMSLATIALRNNLMTIKQVSQALDIAESSPEKTFSKIAMEQDWIDRADADRLLIIQQNSCPSLRKLVVECGLLTQRQVSVLFLHFERNGFNKIQTQVPQRAQVQPQQPAPAQPVPAPAAPETRKPTSVRQPKFKQRPVVVRQATQPNS